MLTDGRVSHPVAPNPCWNGYPRIIADRRRQMRLAAIALDRLLIGPGIEDTTAGECWRAVMGPDGRWRQCCRGNAA
jgi:hypothetical protein